MGIKDFDKFSNHSLDLKRKILQEKRKKTAKKFLISEIFHIFAASYRRMRL